MKRSIDEITPSSSDGVPSSSAKKFVTDVDPTDDADMSSKSFLLASQNKSLNKELMRNKRSIAEARKELELMRRKSREMESLVSLIQRAWSQLDIDTSMLLDSLGDSEVQVSDEGSSELLHRLVNTGVKYMKFDPTHMEGIPTLNADQWSTMEDIEKERVRLHSAVQQKEGRSNSESDNNEHEHERQRPDEDNLDEKYGGPVEENLSGHVSFTMSLLERLCNAINDASGNTALQVDAVSAMNSMRELRAERLILSDRITKLTAEIIDLSAKVRIAETERIRAEASLDRAVAAAKEAQQSSTKTPQDTAEGAVDGQVVPSSPQPSSNPTVERELRRQVALLERQLAESESAKAQVEMTLTERLARPLPQTEVQVADMRNAMEELRQQCKHRVSALIAEGDQLQEKVRNLELALLHLEAISAARIDEVVTLTQKEIAATKADKDAVQATLASLQADVTMIEQLKTQLAEYQGLGELCNSEVAKLQTRVKQLSETQAVLQGNLEQSRGREEALEQALATKAANDALLQSVAVEVVEAVETKAHSRSGSMEEGEERMEVEIPIPAPAPKAILPADYQLLVDQSKARVDDLQKELQNSSSNINDLIMEIETVAAEELKARAQGTRLLQQITECQSMQRVALEENLRLQNQIEDLRASNRDAEAKMELMKSIMVQQESIINQLKSAEHGVRTEFQTVKKSAMQAQGTRHIDEQRLLEARQQLADTEHGVKGALKRNQELQSRCDELSRQCEAERKAKMDTQRELTKLKGAKKDKSANAGTTSGSSNSGGGGGAEETDMLEITLGMLRCSVCKDRFKSCAITRCFHLFCKECIDENLRNRSRKCPACGEKFGQDDVTPVYFN